MSDRGDIKIPVSLTNGKHTIDVSRTIVIRNVMYVPDLSANLISCSQLCKDGYDIKFKGHRGRALLNGMIEFECIFKDGVYVINCSTHNYQELRAMHVSDATMSLWHDRLGHANMRSIRKLQSTNAVSGLDLSSKMKQNGNHFRDCKRGNSTRQP